jgi:NAD(P)-dependent dehydrogenase (short-subunit alcohol dehydrogenase family)
MDGTDSLFSPAYDRVLVTGGGSGIGRAVTLELTRRGVDVWILGRREEKLAETAEMCRTHRGAVDYVSCDTREMAQVDAAFARINGEGPVQALVHAAAEVRPCAAERLTPEIFQEAVQSLLVGAFNIYHAWMRPLIRAGKDGALICYTSSPGGRETPGLSHSSATKAGMEGLLRTWAVELGRHGLRLNAIAPGLFPFDTTLAARDTFFDVDRFMANVPLGRFGVPDEIVAPTLFLLSKGASYITGAVLHVDGGLRLRPNFGFTAEGLERFGADV